MIYSAGSGQMLPPGDTKKSKTRSLPEVVDIAVEKCVQAKLQQVL